MKRTLLAIVVGIVMLFITVFTIMYFIADPVIQKEIKLPTLETYLAAWHIFRLIIWGSFSVLCVGLTSVLPLLITTNELNKLN